MALKDILVHIDSSTHLPTRLEAAMSLARTHGAHLIGAHVISAPEIPEFVRPHLSDALLERQHAGLLEHARELRKTFEAACAEAGVSHEWRLSEGNLVDCLVRQFRYVDLGVLSQRDTHEEPQVGSREVPDRVVLAAGRPALVVPTDGAHKPIGRSVVVAWDASRLATRALNDAMPILVEAEKVIVLVVNTNGQEHAKAGAVTGANISAHLNRRGIPAEPKQVFDNGHHIGQMVLAEVERNDGDLVVMGAWGHQRWREMVLGGLTRFMMRHMTVPVLMSH